MLQKKIVLKSGWLHFPIGRDVPRYYVQFSADGQQFAELYLGLAPENPDFYCGMELSGFNGREITLSVAENAPCNLLNGVVEGGDIAADNPLYADLYHEALRPRYHFSTKRGWINDPNGLVFDGRNYHLYYQHNPFGILHGGVNIHWGHAVSPDGIHWVEHSDALRPWTSMRHIASGSCIVDENGIAGYGEGTLIAAFTHLGSRNFHVMPDEEYPSEGQFLAYSRDGGDSFSLFPDNPVIPSQNGNSWRDPRLFAHPDGGFGIAVYETTENGNCVSFYRSDDLHRWEWTARTDDLYECPDLFKLTPVNDARPRWVLYGADGMYRIGDFVNGAFHQEGGRCPMDFGKCTYAGQTWNGRDDADGRMHISWLRDESLSWTNPSSYPGMGFSQCMTVPCLLTLIKTRDGYRVNRNPVPAIDTLRNGEQRTYSFFRSGELAIHPFLAGDTQLTVSARQPVTIRVGDNRMAYVPSTGLIHFDGGADYTLQRKGDLHLRFLTDVMSCEFFLQQEISASYGIYMKERPIVLSCEDEFSVHGVSYAFSDIWP